VKVDKKPAAKGQSGLKIQIEDDGSYVEVRITLIFNYYYECDLRLGVWHVGDDVGSVEMLFVYGSAILGTLPRYMPYCIRCKIGNNP